MSLFKRHVTYPVHIVVLSYLLSFLVDSSSTFLDLCLEIVVKGATLLMIFCVDIGSECHTCLML